jgi:hypothetical protein
VPIPPTRMGVTMHTVYEQYPALQMGRPSHDSYLDMT